VIIIKRHNILNSLAPASTQHIRPFSEPDL
jgi:hypothetical protein